MTRSIVLFTLLACAGSAAAEPALLTRADALRERPFSDAKVVLPLPAGKGVDIQTRDGAWYQVTVDGKSGWVSMLAVRRTAPAAAASVGSLSQTATGRTATGSIVSSTGVRGLNEEELSAAKFSESAIAAAEKFKVAPEEAAAFARDGGLAPRKVPPLAPSKGEKP